MEELRVGPRRSGRRLLMEDLWVRGVDEAERYE